MQRKVIISAFAVLLVLMMALCVLVSCNVVDEFYKITYFANGEFVSLTNVIAGEALTARDIPVAPASATPGEVFDCWMANGEVIEVGYVPKSDLRAEAVYRSPMIGEYIVSFDLGEYSGSEAAPSDMVASANGMIVLPSVSATWLNYEFAGWVLDGQLYPVGYTYQVTSNVTFVAQWNYYGMPTLHFETNGGSVIGDIQGEKGSAVTAPAEPVKDGYTFAGWYTNASFNGEAVQIPNVMPSGSYTYYAKWVTRYTIRRQLQNVAGDGYDAQDEVHDIDEGEPIGPIQLYKAIVGFRYVSGEEAVVPQNGGVYEVTYNRQHYTVTYRLNIEGYTVTKEYTDDVVYGEQYTIEGALYSGDGFLFKGWSESADGSVIESETIDITGDLELFAKWLTGNYDLDGGGDYVYYDPENPDEVLLQREGIDVLTGTYNAVSKKFAFTLTPEYGTDVTLTGTLDLNAGTFRYDKEGQATYYSYDEKTHVVDTNYYVILDGGGTVTVNVPEGVFVNIEAVISGGTITDFRQVSLSAGSHTGTYIYDSDNYEYVMTIDGTQYGFSTGWATQSQETNPDMLYYDVFFPRGIEAGYYSEGLTAEGLDGVIAVLTGYGFGYILIGDEEYAAEYALQTVEIAGEEYDEVVFDLTEQLGTTLKFMVLGEVGTMKNGQVLYQFIAYDGTAAGTYEGDYFGTAGGYTLNITGYGMAYLTNSEDRDSAPQSLVYLVRDVCSVYNVQDDYSEQATISYVIAIIDLYNPVYSDSGQLIDPGYYASVYGVSSDDGKTFDWLDPSAVGVSYADMTLYGRDFGYLLLFTDGEDGNGMIWFDNYGYPNEGTMSTNQGDGGFPYYTFNDPYGGYYNFDFAVYRVGEKQYAFNIDTTPLAGVYEDASGSSLLIIDPTGAVTYYNVYLGVFEGGYIDYEDSTYLFVAPDEGIMFDFMVDNESGIFTILDQPHEDTYYMFNGENYYSNVYITVDEEGNVTFTYVDEDILKGTASLYDAAAGTWFIKVTEVLDEETVNNIGLANGFFVQFLSARTEDGYVELFVLDDGMMGMYQLSDSVTLSLDGFGTGYLTLDTGIEQVTLSGAYELQYDSMFYDDDHIIVYLVIGSTEFYFDFWNDGSITMRGSEGYKTYYLTDGSSLYNFLLLLDGNGNADIIFHYTDDEGYANYFLAETGAYEMLTGGYGVVQFTFDEFYVDGEYWTDQDEVDFVNQVVSMLPSFGITDKFVFCLVTLGTYDAFIIYDEYYDDVTVLTDGSVLITDGFFGATYIDTYGAVYDGTYVVEYYGESDDDGYILIRFYGDYGDDFTFVTGYVDDNIKQVGNEYGSYDDGASNEIFLNGNGYITYVQNVPVPGTENDNTYTGSYTYDENLHRVEATLTSLNGDPIEAVTYLFEIDIDDRYCLLKDDTQAGEFVNTDNDADKMYGNGFGTFLRVDEDGERTIWYLYLYNNQKDLYTIIGLVDDDVATIEVRFDFERHTFTFSDPDLEMSVTSMWDIATGKMAAKTVEVDGFGIVTMDGVPSGTVVSSEEPKSTSNYKIYITSTGAKFVTFIYANSSLGVYGVNVWAPYIEEYDVTLTDGNGANPIVLDGMASAKLPSDTYLRNIFYVQDDVLVTDNFFHTNDNDIKEWTVDWEANTYKEGGTQNDSDFVIEGDVLTAYNGKATEIVIPENVKKIADSVFDASNGGVAITSVDLKNVEEVGAYAFKGEKLTAPTLVTVTGTEHLKIIGQEAFEFCKFTTLDLPAVETIGEKGFYGCQYLENVTIGANCTTIGSSAFKGVAMKGKGSVEYHFKGESAPSLGSATALGTASKVVAIYFTSQTALDQAKAAWTTYTAVCQLEQA